MPSRSLIQAFRPPDLAKGPVAIVFDEDGVALGETLVHLRRAGFAEIFLMGAVMRGLPSEAGPVRLLPSGVPTRDSARETLSAAIAALPGRWLHYCYNAEFLFFPFSGHRRVGEMLAFHAEERRSAMITTVVDL